MKKTKTLKFHFIFITFLILVATGIISGFIFFLISHLGLSRYFEHSPWAGLMVITLASVVIGTLISVLVSKQILRPLEEIIEATKSVSQGDFTVRVKSSPKNSELDALISNFNKMVTELNNVEMVHTDFINNFSHEFKTPITSIQGFAQQLQVGDLTPTEEQEFMEIIVSESGRLARLSSNILQLVNLENQEQLRVKKSDYSLSEQLRNSLVILQGEWEAKNIELRLEIEEVTFNGDEEMMMSLWLNLLKNSIKFSHQGGVIQLECYRLGKQTKVRISDEGIGMSDEVRQSIFAKFYQADLTRQQVGSGLGLAIAKQIVDLHGGSISVKSVLGQGSTFTVIFEQ